MFQNIVKNYQDIKKYITQINNYDFIKNGYDQTIQKILDFFGRRIYPNIGIFVFK